MFTVQRTMGSGEADGNELLDLMATDFGGPVSPQTGIVKTDGVGKMLPADFHPHHGRNIHNHWYFHLQWSGRIQSP